MIEGEEVSHLLGVRVLNYVCVNYTNSWSQEVIDLALSKVQMHIELGKVVIKQLVYFLDILLGHLTQSLNRCLSWEF